MLTENQMENIINRNEEILNSKKMAKEVVDLFRHFDEKQSKKIDNCASTLVFQFDMNSGQRKLASANFCHNKFCPECSRRRSRLMYHNLKKVLTIAKKEYNQEFIHFTLSLKNCKKEDLKKSLDELFHGFITMMKRGQFEYSINGWYRNLEITYNEKEDTLHPHLHVILAVDKDYFRKYSKKYLTQEYITEEFKTACQVDYNPIVFLKKVYSKKKNLTAEEKLHSLVAECSKYVTKMADFLNLENEDLKVGLLESLSKGLFKRRMCAYGKLLRKIFKDLKLESEETSDLINIEEQEIILGDNCVFGIFSYNKKEQKYKLVKVLEHFVPAWKVAEERKRLMKKKENNDTKEFIKAVKRKTLKAYLSR